MFRIDAEKNKSFGLLTKNKIKFLLVELESGDSVSLETDAGSALIGYWNALRQLN